MILHKLDVDEVFDKLASNVTDKNPMAIDSILKTRPLDISMMDWRYELKGLTRGLVLAGLLPENQIQFVQRKLFGHFQLNGKARPGREHKFSLDVYSKQIKEGLNVFDFDVAATNPTDAYVQLSKRLVFRSIPDIERIEVFDNFKRLRERGQSPTKIFDKDSLIFVKTD